LLPGTNVHVPRANRPSPFSIGDNGKGLQQFIIGHLLSACGHINRFKNHQEIDTYTPTYRILRELASLLLSGMGIALYKLTLLDQTFHSPSPGNLVVYRGE
jgi:hypothetical protein